jgi:hypothetical protein
MSAQRRLNCFVTAYVVARSESVPLRVDNENDKIETMRPNCGIPICVNIDGLSAPCANRSVRFRA